MAKYRIMGLDPHFPVIEIDGVNSAQEARDKAKQMLLEQSKPSVTAKSSTTKKTKFKKSK